MARLIDADKLMDEINQQRRASKTNFPKQSYVVGDVLNSILNAPTVDAVEVVHGWWKGYVHSALVRWKDGEPVWADRNVYRCSRCDFGTIAKHNYCPNCGAKMDGGKDNERKAD